MQKDMMVQRKTATKYLDTIVDTGLLQKVKFGRSNYYINTKLMDLFLHHHIDEKITQRVLNLSDNDTVL